MWLLVACVQGVLSWDDFVTGIGVVCRGWPWEQEACLFEVLDMSGCVEWRGAVHQDARHCCMTVPLGVSNACVCRALLPVLLDHCALLQGWSCRGR